MPTINVRQLDRDVFERLKQRALQNDRSLEGEARHILKCATEDELVAKRAAFLAESDRLRKSTTNREHTPAEVLIREDRAYGHREP